jgi:hypothetical protein
MHPLILQQQVKMILNELTNHVHNTELSMYLNTGPKTIHQVYDYIQIHLPYFISETDTTVSLTNREYMSLGQLEGTDLRISNYVIDWKARHKFAGAPIITEGYLYTGPLDTKAKLIKYLLELHIWLVYTFDEQKTRKSIKDIVNGFKILYPNIYISDKFDKLK